MDPLSITAGIIAISGAALTTGSTISKFRASSHAPELFDELSNEVESMRTVLGLMQMCLLNVPDAETCVETSAGLKALIRRAQHSLLKLQKILEYQLRSGEGRDSIGRAKVSRLQWMRLEPKIERLKQEIRDATIKLHAGLTALNTISGDTTRRLVVQIRDMQLAPNHRTNAFEINPGRHSAHRIETNSNSDYSNLSQHFRCAALVNAASSVETPTEDISRSIALYDNMTIDASNARARFPPCCTCECHVRIYGRTPEWLDNVFGQLLFSYARPCTQYGCRQRSYSSSYSYRFPPWWSTKVVEISAQHYASTGPITTWTLKTYITVPWYHEAYQVILCGEVARLKNMISKGHVHPRMVGENGSLLQLSILMRHHDCTDVLAKAGFEANLELLPIGTSMLFRSLLIDRESLGLEDDDLAQLYQIPRLHRKVAFWRRDQLELAQIIRDNAPDMEVKNALGMTLLHWACMVGSLEVVRVLLESNANLNVQSLDGRTPLQLACQALSNHTALVKILLQHGARVEIPDNLNRTAIFYALDGETVDLLMSYGAEISSVNARGSTILHVLASGRYNWPSRNAFDPATHPDGSLRRRRLVETLVRYGADIDATNSFGGTPLFTATEAEMVNILVELGAQVDFRGRSGDTALHCASNSETVDALVACGAQIDVASSFGSTPLHYAAVNDRSEVITALLRHGANVYATDSRGRTPVHRAIANDSVLALDALRKASEQHGRRDYRISTCYGNNFLHIAALYASPETMSVLSSFDLKGHDPEARELSNYTPDELFRKYRDRFYGAPFRSRTEELRSATQLLAEARRQNSYERFIQVNYDSEDVFFEANEARAVEMVARVGDYHTITILRLGVGLTQCD